MQEWLLPAWKYRLSGGEKFWHRAGIIVRSRSVIGNLGAALQTIVGGNITILTNLCEKTREDAFELLLQHAAEHGANAVIGMRYDATEVMQGVTEVLATVRPSRLSAFPSSAPERSPGDTEQW